MMMLDSYPTTDDGLVSIRNGDPQIDLLVALTIRSNKPSSQVNSTIDCVHITTIRDWIDSNIVEEVSVLCNMLQAGLSVDSTLVQECCNIQTQASILLHVFEDCLIWKKTALQ